MQKAKFISFASVISEIQQSDLFMTVKARILETPKANLNGASVTEDFVDDIISNAERYVGLPLYADVRALKNGNYNRLGHLYDSRTGEFHSTQIGSFYQFEKEEFEGGAYLVGYARIPKRDKALSKAIAELFADSALKFSFEIACADYEELEDGTFVIDASENNYLEGTAIVTFPACEDAVALEFVAQREADDTRKGDAEMAEVEKLETKQEELVAEETEAVETSVEEVQAEVEQTEAEAVEAEQAETETVEIAEAEETEATEEVAEETEDAACKKHAEEEDAECKKENAEEVAAVYMHEGHVEEHTTCMYDSETGKDVCQTVRVETHISEPIEGEIVETDEGVTIAEAGDDPVEPETPVETPAEPETPVEDPADPEVPENPVEPPAEEVVDTTAPILPGEEKKTAEQLIAELAEKVTALAEEVRELKAQRVVASQTIAAEVNPFTDTIRLDGQKYTLLDSEEPCGHYTLI